MSTALGIAAVTATLRDLLNNGLLDRKTNTGDVTVSVLPPDRVWPATGNKTNSLNLFLYHVSTNPGYRNHLMPQRDSDGNRVTNPPLALDLYYMLTAYGVEDFNAEILLGHGMQILHETSVLTKKHIEAALGGPGVAVSGDDLPADVTLLGTADLANQLESIKLSPYNCSVDEAYKLWSAFQSPYRPSAYYMATVLLIESHRPTRASLPVKERVVVTVPLLHPSITAVEPLIVPFSGTPTLTLKGSGLKEVGAAALVGDIAAPISAGASDSSMVVTLPSGVLAGPNQVRIVHRALMPDGTFRTSESSNSAPFLYAPQIRPKGPGLDVTPVLTGAPLKGKITVKIDPPAGKDQKVTLLLNPAAASAGTLTFAAPTRLTDADTIVFTVAGLAVGDYLIRVEVDGAQSPLTQDVGGNYVGPKVNLT